MFRFIAPLLWKSWCIRKRHYIVSLFELVTPIGMFILLLYLKSNIPDSKDDFVANMTFTPESKNDLIQQPYLSLNSHNIEIAFAPSNDKNVKAIIDQVNITLLSNQYFVSLIPCANESEISKIFYEKYSNTTVYGNMIYGLIFTPKLSYTLRPVSSSFQTENLFPPFSTPGPGYAYNTYFKEGFVLLQIVINDAIHELKHPGSKSLNFSMTQFPYPSYYKVQNDKFKMFFSMTIPLITLFGYYSFVPSLISYVIQEKNSGSKEWMSMVGIPRTMILFSWILHAMSFYLITTIVCSGILVSNVLETSMLSSSNVFFIWLILYLFCTCTVVYLLAVTSFINNPNVAVIFGSFAWILPSVASSSYQNAKSMSYVVKILSCFFPSCALNWAFTTISNYESNNETITLFNLFNTNSGRNDISLGIVLIFLLGTPFLYGLLFLYIDSVKPGKFGRARPWYFPFSVIYRLFAGKKADEDFISGDPNLRKKTFEDITALSVGLSFQNIKKHFGNVIAVEDATIDIYKGQITALLGHNGAGKTTLINIITGMFSPTRGKIWRDGKNVFEDFPNFQKNLGLCPQHDLLFPYLNVIEHVLFFGMLRGLSRSQALKDSRELLNFFGIKDKAHCLTKKLSGGMKRKLSLSISLIGNPEILILDEPTSGMDPESRRDTWNKLLTLRGDRTIILTTHYMEEADVLGDMIAIMDHGVIKCYGSSLFLKKQYGSGYKLTVPADYEDLVAEIIKPVVPEVSMPLASGPSVSFSLPLEKSSLFSNLFSQLENRLPKSVRISVACTTLDDVFMKVAHSGSDELDSSMHDEEVLLIDSNKGDEIHSSSEALNPKAITGFDLFMRRLFALFMKKLLYNRHRWASWFFLTILYPVTVFIVPLSITSAILKGEFSNPSLAMNLNIYGNTDVVISPSSNSSLKTLSDSFINIVKQEGSNAILLKNATSIDEALLYIGTENLSKYRYSYIIASNFLSSVTNVFYSSIGIHSPAIAVNLLYKSWFSAEDSDGMFETYNHPFNLQDDICSNGGQAAIALVLPGIWIFTVPLVMAVISFSFARLHHDERLNSGKLLQLMTGTSPVLYWLSAYLCDFCLFLISSLVLIIWVYTFDTASLFSTPFDFGVLLLILLISCTGNTWFGYLTSYFLRTFSRLFSVNMFIAFLLGQVSYFIIALFKSFNDSNDSNTAEIFHYIFMFYPSYCSSALFFKLISNLALYFVASKCSKGSGLVIDRQPLFTWDENGINRELVYIICDCFIFASLIYLVDYGLLAKLSNYIFNLYAGPIDQTSSVYDEDIEIERSNVEAATTNLNAYQSYILVNSLGKKYSRKVTAVKDINFLIPRGQCFGLLGVNGAGKSTTFKMLTGDLLPSVGQAVLFGDDLRTNKLKYQSHIGYCPQTDAIIEALTGSEMLKLYASLRGVNPLIINRTISYWISEFGLQNVCNRKCETYSGGNKRKLSTAISLIGDPQVVFLDEPTTGVDPVARRKFWTVLAKLQKKGCSIILTSHSMDECETVCDRLTIMANGEMKCLGNIQRLKEIYGQGSTIIIQLGQYSDSDLQALKCALSDAFSSHAILRDEHIGLLHYHINCPNYKWSTLFSTMESLKETNSIIKEYTISETTLEQIFLHFAKV